MSETPEGARIYARKRDGTEADITEGVQSLYDIVIQSMDWGSGFLTVEEAIPVAHLAEVCGFKGAEEPQRYLRERRREDLRDKMRREGMSFQQAYDVAKRAFPDPA